MFQGAYVALVTPFINGQVDEESLRSLVEFQIESGTTGLVPCGTTGESATLSHEEHHRVIDIVIDAAKGRVPVIAGAGSNSTREAIELTKHAKAAGADAALHVSPYYVKPTQEGLYRHFEAIAKEAKLPMVVYNIFGRSSVNIEPKTMARIAELPEAVAVKEASGNLGQMAEMINLCGDKVDFLSGDDGLVLPLLAIGGKGVISVVNNIVPKKVIEVVDDWFAGDIDGAREKANAMLPLVKAMFMETSPIPVKVAMEMMKLIPSGELRLPMCDLMPENRKKLHAVLESYGLLG